MIRTFLLFIVLVAGGLRAQTGVTRAQLHTLIDEYWPDNETEEISPADLRYIGKLLADSALFPLTDGAPLSASAIGSAVQGFIPAGTTAQYWRGDKSWQPLNKAAVGLPNADNTSDADKPISTATQTALAAKASTSDLATKEPTIAAGTSAQYWRGDKSWQPLNKAAVGLSSVDNTSDADKPISTATQSALAGKASASDLATKEPTITAGTTAQYWRGDKSWQPLNKAAVGLSNVDNTSDADKPISAAAEAALAGKAPASHTHSSSEIADWAAAARAQVESMLVAGSNVTLTPSGSGATRQLTLAASGGGGGGWTSGLLFATSGSTSISNSTTETSIIGGTVPGGTLGTQGCIRVIVSGQVLNSSGSNGTFVLKLKYGATTLYADTSISVANNATARTVRIEAHLFADADAALQRLEGVLTISGAAAATTGYGGIDSGPLLASAVFGGTAAEDSSADKTLDVTVQLSAANANFTWTTYKAAAWRL